MWWRRICGELNVWYSREWASNTSVGAIGGGGAERPTVEKFAPVEKKNTLSPRARADTHHCSDDWMTD